MGGEEFAVRGCFFCDAVLDGATEKGGSLMASPQFLTPKPVKASRNGRKFSLAQANRALPLVRRIVADIMRTHEEVARQQVVLEMATNQDRPAIQAVVQSMLDHFQDYLDELTDIGCELKDYRRGLVDFIGSHKGHDVCLCWQFGEERIGYWHELASGFDGRQPISLLEECTA